MIRAKHPILHNNVAYPKGDIIEGLTKSEEERLVRLKSAEYVISPEEELRKQIVANDVKVIPPELFEEYAKALDEEYNAEELKREAKEVAIIKQGKADELLEDDSDE